MTKVSPFSPEARDPFFVPDRTAEAMAFLFAAAFTGLTVAVPFIVPQTITNVAVTVLGGLISVSFWVEGFKERKHRLRRLREVAELTAKFLATADQANRS